MVLMHSDLMQTTVDRISHSKVVIIIAGKY